jgi:cytoskeletal protein RodZ
MNKNLSDEKLDQILEKIVKDSLLKSEMIEEIADSPKLRWNVQSRIKQEKAIRAKSWFPLWNWQIAAFASLIFVFCLSLIWSVNFRENNSIAEVKPVDAPITKQLEIGEKEFEPETKIEDKTETAPVKNVPKTSAAKIVSPKIKPKSNTLAKKQKTEIAPKNNAETLAKTEPIKTDFIALSYSPAPESGQILKVKVPRSMMVSLGVAANVENASQLVNAEVVMGDDGLARSIRFVQ